jgi:hypothetical protein
MTTWKNSGETSANLGDAWVGGQGLRALMVGAAELA